MIIHARLLLGVATALLAGPTVAQDFSDEELLARIGEQIALKAPTRGTDDTRAVDIVVLDGEGEVVSGTDEGAVAQVEGGAELRPVDVDSAPEAGTSPDVVEYARFGPEEAINIQIQFAFDSALILPSEAPKIAQICRIMDQAPEVSFLVAGHTDDSGTEDYNKVLSRLRAEEVERRIVACGIDAARLQAVGLGETYPLEEAAPAAEENRRVEIQVLV